MTTNEKEIIINEAIDLISELINKGYTNYRIAKETKITDRTIGNYVNKTNKPSFANAKILLSYYRGANQIPTLSSSRQFIRYWVDVDVTGGGVALFDDTLSDNYEDMLIPEFRDCTDAVNLYGDSMSPRYNAGQIIILKEWTDSFIAFGQVYLVITKSGFRTVKYLRKGAKETEVLCVSENKNYDPFPVNRDDILKLYLVKGTIEKTTL